jgi:hypothetical protein
MPVWWGAKDLDLRTPAEVRGVVVKRRVCCVRRHGCARGVRSVVSGVVGDDRSSRRCSGVCSDMVGVWLCVMRRKSSGIDGQMGNVGGAERTGLFGGGFGRLIQV